MRKSWRLSRTSVSNEECRAGLPQFASCYDEDWPQKASWKQLLERSRKILALLIKMETPIARETPRRVAEIANLCSSQGQAIKVVVETFLGNS